MRLTRAALMPAEDPTIMTLFIQQLFNGLALGGVYCLAAIGLTLVF